MDIRSIHFILLGILSDGPKHGYQIHKCINDPEGIGMIWNIKITNIYGLLDVLEKKTYIEPSDQIGDDSSYPPKKYFEMTPKGEEVFKKWLSEPVKHGREMRQVFLSKLYFAERNDSHLAHQLILDQLAECKHWLENSKQTSNEEPHYIQTVKSFRTMQFKSYIDWLEGLKERY